MLLAFEFMGLGLLAPPVKSKSPLPACSRLAVDFNFCSSDEGMYTIMYISGATTVHSYDFPKVT